MTAVAIATAVTGCDRGALARWRQHAATPASGGPVAAILAGGPHERLLVVDLLGKRVTRTVKLRSFAQFCAADVAARRIVTAQCGLVGTAADSACGVVGVDAADTARYVATRVPNPTDVAVLGRTAYVVHGFEQRQGLCLSAVDLDRSVVASEAHVPAGTTAIFSACGRVLVVDSVEAEGRGSSRSRLSVIDTRTLKTRTLVEECPAGATVVEDPLSVPSRPTLLLLGSRDASSADARRRTGELWRVDVRTGDVLQTARLSGLVVGAFGGCATRSRIAVLDASDAGGQPDEGGVVLFDTRTLAPCGRLKATAPLALASWGEHLLVVCREPGDRPQGKLAMFDPGRTTPSAQVTLGPLEVMVDIAVLDAR